MPLRVRRTNLRAGIDFNRIICFSLRFLHLEAGILKLHAGGFLRRGFLREGSEAEKARDGQKGER